MSMPSLDGENANSGLTCIVAIISESEKPKINRRKFAKERAVPDRYEGSRCEFVRVREYRTIVSLFNESHLLCLAS